MLNVETRTCFAAFYDSVYFVIAGDWVQFVMIYFLDYKKINKLKFIENTLSGLLNNVLTIEPLNWNSWRPTLN